MPQKLSTMDTLLKLSRRRDQLSHLTVLNRRLPEILLSNFKLSSGNVKETLKINPNTCTAAGCLPTLMYCVRHVDLQQIKELERIDKNAFQTKVSM